MRISDIAQAVERLSDHIDCEDLEHADFGTLDRLRNTCTAMVAAVEAEQGFRKAHPAVQVTTTPLAWTTTAFSH